MNTRRTPISVALAAASVLCALLLVVELLARFAPTIQLLQRLLSGGAL